MTCQKLIRRLSTVQVLTSYFFNFSITLINDNDLVHVEHIPFYLPHQKKKFELPHISIIKSPAQLKMTSKLRFQLAKTPGQKLRPQVFSSLILKQKKCPLEQKGPQTFPSKEANTGPKHCKQSIKCLWGPRMLRKNLSPWLLEAVKIHQEKVYPVCAFCRHGAYTDHCQQRWDAG